MQSARTSQDAESYEAWQLAHCFEAICEPLQLLLDEIQPPARGARDDYVEALREWRDTLARVVAHEVELDSRDAFAARERLRRNARVLFGAVGERFADQDFNTAITDALKTAK